MRQPIHDILKRKDLFITTQQDELEQLIVELGAKFANDLARIVARGATSGQEIRAALEALGYDKVIAAKLDKFDELFAFSKELFKVLGIRAILTPQNEINLLNFLFEIGSAVVEEIKGSIQKDMTRFAIQSKISQVPTAEIISQVKDKFATVGRRAGTEVATALAQFDRATSKLLYENAGVTLFTYFGPNDEVTRDSCKTLLANPQNNETGFTVEEINNMPDIDFVLGGKPYYNCRHEFLPVSVI